MAKLNFCLTESLPRFNAAKLILVVYLYRQIIIYISCIVAGPYPEGFAGDSIEEQESQTQRANFFIEPWVEYCSPKKF